jgi:hypothetical protein
MSFSEEGRLNNKAILIPEEKKRVKEAVTLNAA